MDTLHGASSGPMQWDSMPTPVSDPHAQCPCTVLGTSRTLPTFLPIMVTLHHSTDCSVVLPQCSVVLPQCTEVDRCTSCCSPSAVPPPVNCKAPKWFRALLCMSLLSNSQKNTVLLHNWHCCYTFPSKGTHVFNQSINQRWLFSHLGGGPDYKYEVSTYRTICIYYSLINNKSA